MLSARISRSRGRRGRSPRHGHSRNRPRARQLTSGLRALPAIFLLTAVGLSGAVPATAGPVALPAQVVPFQPHEISEKTYPGVDHNRTRRPSDDRSIRTTWRVAEGVGNCCETYFTITEDGRLLDFGGRYVHYTDDRGQTWFRVAPLVPLVNGEGAIVAAPGGDVLGVEWDPYSGDHLQFYKYEADTDAWSYAEMPVHPPFYDREWIGVVPGPITVDGATHEYVSFVKGGARGKEVWFYSTDGIHYVRVTSKEVGKLLSGTTFEGPLPTARNPDSDWIQPNTNVGMTQLGAGDLLAAPDVLDDWSLLRGEDFSWSSYAFPDGTEPQGLFQTDSAGRLHNVIRSPNGETFEYRISRDGGATWKSTTVTLPRYHVIQHAGPMPAIDFRANRVAGVAAVAIRAQNLATGLGQDLAYKFDIRRGKARLLRMYEIGLGDLNATCCVGNEIRFDFASVAIFGDGRLAVSFLDSTTKMVHPVQGREIFAPAVAIEGDTEYGGRIPVDIDPPPSLGEPYASYTFDEGAEGWTSSGLPPWSRGAPGTKDGSNDPTTASFGIEGPMYIDNANGSLVSPPIPTEEGDAVVKLWLKMDLEDGFDFLLPEWSADGVNWAPMARLTGQNEAYPEWNELTLGFGSPGGDVRVRFRLVSDRVCSGMDPACGRLYGGVRVDEVVVGRQGESAGGGAIR